MEYFKMGDGRLHVGRLITLFYAVSLTAIRLGHSRKIDDPYLWLDYLWVAGFYILACAKNPMALGRRRRFIAFAMMLGSLAGTVYFTHSKG